LGSFLDAVQEDLGHLAAVRTPTGSTAGIGTWLGWGGSTVTVLSAGWEPAPREPHVAAVRDAVARRLFRVRVLTLTAAVAVRVAATVSITGGALFALPVAYRLVRTVTGTARDGNAH
jgi:hypothetical protein